MVPVRAPKPNHPAFFLLRLRLLSTVPVPIYSSSGLVGLIRKKQP